MTGVLRRLSSSESILRSVGSRDTLHDSRSAFGGENPWQRLQAATLTIFQSKPGSPLPELDHPMLGDTCRQLMQTDARNFISTYLQDSLLRRCFRIVRESLDHESDGNFLPSLTTWWTHFYRQVLPLVCMIFTPLPTFGLTVRQMCLKVFREVVLVEVLPRLQGIAEKNEQSMPAEVTQMVLVSQSIPDTTSEEYSPVERLASKIVKPYIVNMRAVAEKLEAHPAGDFVVPNPYYGTYHPPGGSFTSIHSQDHFASPKVDAARLERERLFKLGSVSES